MGNIRVGNKRCQRLNNTYHYATDHCSDQVSDPTEHGCSKSEQTEFEADGENSRTFFQAIDKASRPCQTGTNEKGERDDAVNVHPHEGSGLTILRDGAHCSTDARPSNHPLQSYHQYKCYNDHQDTATIDGDRPERNASLQKHFMNAKWKGDELIPFPEFTKILQDQRHSNGRDKRGKTRSIAQGTV